MTRILAVLLWPAGMALILWAAAELAGRTPQRWLPPLALASLIDHFVTQAAGQQAADRSVREPIGDVPV
jgi:hypothetical protein